MKTKKYVQDHTLTTALNDVGLSAGLMKRAGRDSYLEPATKIAMAVLPSLVEGFDFDLRGATYCVTTAEERVPLAYASPKDASVPQFPKIPTAHNSIFKLFVMCAGNRRRPQPPTFVFEIEANDLADGVKRWTPKSLEDLIDIDTTVSHRQRPITLHTSYGRLSSLSIVPTDNWRSVDPIPVSEILANITLPTLNRVHATAHLHPATIEHCKFETISCNLPDAYREGFEFEVIFRIGIAKEFYTVNA